MDSAPPPLAPLRFRPDPPIVIGLLGGVASGKSTVSALFAEHGLVVLDADAIAKELTKQPAVLAAIADRFGTDVLNADGSLARERLAQIVFRDPAKKRELEALIHPKVREHIATATQAALARGDSVLLDVPLLLENGLIALCTTCVFVAASDSVRRERARARGWSEGELERREANQADLTLKMARCAHTIRNDGSRHDTARQVLELLRLLGQTPRLRS